MGPRSTERIGPRDSFSSLKWWQKVLFGLAAFVVFLTLLLLPRNFSVDLVASALASTFAVSYLSVKGWWQRILLIGLSSAALTAVLLFTEVAAPYGVVVVGAIALLLSFLTGWRDGGPPPIDRRV